MLSDNFTAKGVEVSSFAFVTSTIIARIENRNIILLRVIFSRTRYFNKI